MSTLVFNLHLRAASALFSPVCLLLLPSFILLQFYRKLERKERLAFEFTIEGNCENNRKGKMVKDSIKCPSKMFYTDRSRMHEWLKFLFCSVISNILTYSHFLDNYNANQIKMLFVDPIQYW